MDNHNFHDKLNPRDVELHSITIGDTNILFVFAIVLLHKKKGTKYACFFFSIYNKNQRWILRIGIFRKLKIVRKSQLT